MRGALILGVAILYGFVSYSYGLVPYFFQQGTVAAEEVDELEGVSETVRNDSFLLGQYYFNHDEDPAPPYDLKKARYYFEHAIKNNPKGNNLAWYQLGRVNFLEGKFDAAILCFNKQLEYFGDEVVNTYYMLGLTYGYKARKEGLDEDWVNAADSFNWYLHYAPEDPWAQTDLAWVYFAQGKFEHMLPVLVHGLKGNPNHPWLLNMYGLALMNTGELEAAGEVFKQAKSEASKLTEEEWGKAYPGNSPIEWHRGLTEFRETVDSNIELITQKLSTS